MVGWRLSKECYIIPDGTKCRSGIHQKGLNNRYYVYILSNKRNGTLYIGFTDDLERRMREHKLKEVDGFTKKYGLCKLMYYEIFNSSNEAFPRERRLKKWKRKWKIELLESKNPEWKDLSNMWDE